MPLKEYRISREAFINTTPEKIFPYINHSKLSNDWMPWKDSDPKVQMTFSGPESGVGSKSNWQSPGKMGIGEALVIESKPNESVKTKLTYRKPLSMEQVATISLRSQAGGTLVRWEVEGKNSLLGRIFCLFMDMDKMVGKEFEKGLGKLKQITESK